MLLLCCTVFPVYIREVEVPHEKMVWQLYICQLFAECLIYLFILVRLSTRISVLLALPLILIHRDSTLSFPAPSTTTAQHSPAESHTATPTSLPVPSEEHIVIHCSTPAVAVISPCSLPATQWLPAPPVCCLCSVYWCRCTSAEPLASLPKLSSLP